MDVVDLKYWNILQRKGDKVTAINIYNSPELFEDFEFTGLNNFDLFSSDFIARHKKMKKVAVFVEGQAELILSW